MTHSFVDELFKSLEKCPHCGGKWSPHVTPIVGLGDDPQFGAIFICRLCEGEVRVTLKPPEN